MFQNLEHQTEKHWHEFSQQFTNKFLLQDNHHSESSEQDVENPESEDDHQSAAEADDDKEPWENLTWWQKIWRIFIEQMEVPIPPKYIPKKLKYDSDSDDHYNEGGEKEKFINKR